MNDPICFYVNAELSQIDVIKDDLLRYMPMSKKYLICHELGITGKSHFHIIAEFSVVDYNKYRTNILINKYLLKAKNKEYGKVSSIRDVNKMISYCLKDEGDRRTNLSPDVVEQYLRDSYKKDTKRAHYQNCLDNMFKINNSHILTDTQKEYTIQNAKVHIIKYYKDHQLSVNWNLIQRLFDDWLSSQDISPSFHYDILRMMRKKCL
jgi:hypothetical protein